MSKIGKLPVKIADGVKVSLNGSTLDVTGSKGNLKLNIPKGVDTKIEGDKIILSISKEDKQTKSNWGTSKKLIENMIKGVSDGWQKQLELVGTGYRAEVSGTDLILHVGYSHPIKILAPDNISFKIEKGIVTVDGIDRQVVGQISAEIRATRPPEPYKGKGVKYVGEIIRRKAGKAAKAAV